MSYSFKHGLVSCLLAVVLVFGGVPFVAQAAELAGDSSHGADVRASLDVPIAPVSLGLDHSMAIASDGSLRVWGSGGINGNQLGIGVQVGTRATPVEVESLSDLRAVSSSINHSATIASDGSLWAWGDNNKGQLGDGTTQNCLSPVKVALDSVAQTSMGYYHSGAVTSDGSLWMWGDNSSGQLGDGTTENRQTPVKVKGMDDVVAVALGGYHSAAVKADGTLWMWGRSANGALGNGDANGVKHVYEPIEIMQDVAFASLGYNVTAAVKADGTLWMWGQNDKGQLGDGTTEKRAEPIQVRGMDDVVAVSLGDGYSAAMKSDGSLWMWGGNDCGQLGDGTTENRTIPVRVQGLDNVVAVSLGSGHAAALTSDGSLWMWGKGGNGQLGDGKKSDSLVPVLTMRGVMLPAAPPAPEPEPEPEPSDPADDPVDYEQVVQSLLSSAPGLGSASLEGPKLDLLGESVPLFEQEIAVDPLLDSDRSFTCELDTESNILNVLLDTSPHDDEEGKLTESEEWKDTLSFIAACKRANSAKEIGNAFASVLEKRKIGKRKIVFEGDSYSVGYFRLQLDSQGRIVKMIDGGLATGVSVGVAVTTPLWGIVYSELGIDGSIDGAVSLVAERSRLGYLGTASFEVSPHIALGADVLVADVKGGLAGSLLGDLTFPAASLEKALRLSLTGSLYISVDSWIPGISNEASYDFPNLELYPNLGDVSPRATTLSYEAPEPYSLEDLAGLGRSLSLSRNMIETPVASTVYENAKPSTTVLSDGRALCVYLDTAANGSVRLMYRVLGDSGWSDARPVSGAEEAVASARSGALESLEETAGVLATTPDGSSWVVYGRMAAALRDGMSSEEAARLMELRAARFDASTETFGESILVSPAGQWKYGYSIGAEADGAPFVVWAENSADDVLLKSGSTRILKSGLSESKACAPAELFSSEAVVSEVSAFGEHWACVQDGKLYLDGSLVDTTAFGATVDALHPSSGGLFFRCDGALCSWSSKEGAKKLGARCTASFAVEGEHVFWIEQEGFFSEVRRDDLAGGSAVALTKEGSYVGAFCVVANAAGGNGLLYTCQEVDPSVVKLGKDPFGITVLKYEGAVTRKRAEIANVAYDAMDFDPASANRVAATIRNTGTEPVDTATVVARDSNGNVVGTATTADAIMPGKEESVELFVEFPQGTTAFDLNLSLVAAGLEQALPQAQLTMEAERDMAVEQEGQPFADVSCLVVSNKEEEPVTGARLHLYDGGEGGRLIRTVSIGSLGSKASTSVMLQESDWSAASLDAATSTKAIYCVLEHDGTEYSLWDNSTVVTRVVEGQEKPGAGSNDGESGNGTAKPAAPSVPAKPAAPVSSKKPATQKISLAQAAVTVKAKTYTGKALKPSAPVVKVEGKVLKAGTDFTFSCKGGKKIGSYKVTIAGKGAYTGTKSAVFKVVPKGTGISKLSKAKKGFTVKWKALSKSALKQVFGYEIRYSTTKKFTSATTKLKRVTATSTSGRKRTLKVAKLKGGRTYYVQVRTYKKVGGKIYASSWSRAKSVKTRK